MMKRSGHILGTLVVVATLALLLMSSAGVNGEATVNQHIPYESAASFSSVPHHHHQNNEQEIEAFLAATSFLDENHDDPYHKHPMEDKQSWNLELDRRSHDSQGEAEEEEQPIRTRKLGKYVKVVEDDGDLPYQIMHKQLKDHIPFPGGDTMHGMMIDAGSQGTFTI